MRPRTALEQAIRKVFLRKRREDASHSQSFAKLSDALCNLCANASRRR